MKMVKLMLAVKLLLCFDVATARICTKSHCSFELVIRQRRSMTFTDDDGITFNVAFNDTAGRLQVVENSFHKLVDRPIIGSFVDDDDVITTDGLTRNIYVVNEQFPGPTLEVVEGAKVHLYGFYFMRFNGNETLALQHANRQFQFVHVLKYCRLYRLMDAPRSAGYLYIHEQKGPGFYVAIFVSNRCLSRWSIY